MGRFILSRGIRKRVGRGEPAVDHHRIFRPVAVALTAGTAGGADVPVAGWTFGIVPSADKVCSTQPAMVEVVILAAPLAMPHCGVYGRNTVRLASGAFSSLRNSLICSFYHLFISVFKAFF